MSIERLWLLVNKRRSERSREPVTLTKVQRIVWWLFGREQVVYPKSGRGRPVHDPPARPTYKRGFTYRITHR